ncbi:MAG TPA: HDOD domain-containing protein [Tepidisphaeraceae bacterium]|nr:HDOD domain-containing protein [Tepidisphaeraceae bacterium]
MSDLREKRVELILQQLDELPTLPAIALKVLEVTGSNDSSAADVVRLITSDQSLTARVLQLVHRADVGVRGEVSTVERAILLLGFAAVRSAVLAISIFETFRPGTNSESHQFDREEFWKHSVAVACCAELLTLELRSLWGRDAVVDPSEAFVCGLLHDMGKVALDAVLPKSFSRVVEAADLLRGNIADLERTIIGLDHMVVGKRLAEKWQLPAVVRDCIWLHGQLPQALPATVKLPRMVNLITLADLLVREQHLGYSGNYIFPMARQILIDAIGLTREQVETVLQKLVAHIEPRAQALGLGQASSNELYQQALAQANKELGRVSGQLATKNRKLQIRAKFFDALSGFQAELRPDAPPETVLQAIGQTAVTTLDVTSAAVFSLPPGRDYADAILVDANGEVFEQTIIECSADALSKVKTPMSSAESKPSAAKSSTASALRREPGDGPVMAAGSELEWLLNAVSPRLAHDQRYWICLEADGACIGGVVWGAPAGEAQRLSPQVQEITALASGWSLALRTTQIREEARTLAEQLAEANRQLQTAQNEILRSRTLITVGEMAAGAAHEMNNPLAVISGRSQLLASTLSDAKQKAMAHLIHEQSHRLSQIITELMDFAKPVPAKPIESDLAEIVQRALHEAKMHSEGVDRNIEVTFADVPPVMIDPQQITLALSEVIINAIQATSDAKGQISIHGAFDPYSQNVVLTVADNGSGMDDTTLKRAFDPFFSSRPAGRRRGMGLPKALRWIESSSGSIRLESRPNQGTRAIILLAASKNVASPQPTALRKKA